MRTHSRGFTIVELLVVIAIIGIISSVVIASLNTAREKGTDGKVKATLAGFRPNAEIYFDDNGVYLGFCTDINTVASFGSATSTIASVASPGGFGDGECLDSNSAWAAWVNLREASTTAWCVDSLGSSKLISSQDSGSVDLFACP